MLIPPFPLIAYTVFDDDGDPMGTIEVPEHEAHGVLLDQENMPAKGYITALVVPTSIN